MNDLLDAGALGPVTAPAPFAVEHLKRSRFGARENQLSQVKGIAAREVPQTVGRAVADGAAKRRHEQFGRLPSRQVLQLDPLCQAVLPEIGEGFGRICPCPGREYGHRSSSRD